MPSLFLFLEKHMPTYQMTARKANSQEIEDYQEKIAEKKELAIRNTLCKPLFMLALASLVSPPNVKPCWPA
jgi:hypothetical protein